MIKGLFCFLILILLVSGRLCTNDLDCVGIDANLTWVTPNCRPVCVQTNQECGIACYYSVSSSGSSLSVSAKNQSTFMATSSSSSFSSSAVLLAVFAPLLIVFLSNS